MSGFSCLYLRPGCKQQKITCAVLMRAYLTIKSGSGISKGACCATVLLTYSHAVPVQQIHFTKYKRRKHVTACHL